MSSALLRVTFFSAFAVFMASSTFGCATDEDEDDDFADSNEAAATGGTPPRDVPELFSADTPAEIGAFMQSLRASLNAHLVDPTQQISIRYPISKRPERYTSVSTTDATDISGWTNYGQFTIRIVKDGRDVAVCTRSLLGQMDRLPNKPRASLFTTLHCGLPIDQSHANFSAYFRTFGTPRSPQSYFEYPYGQSLR
jgi:hypothetical protein